MGQQCHWGIKLHENRYLDGIARSAVIGKLEAGCASVDWGKTSDFTVNSRGKEDRFTCTTTLLAAYVPCTLDSSAILPSANRGTSTARFKFVGGVEALEIGRETARASDGACSETHRAELSLA